MTDLADIWTGCGCLFGLGVVVLLLWIGINRGGEIGVLSLVGLIGIIAWLTWAYRTRG